MSSAQVDSALLRGTVPSFPAILELLRHARDESKCTTYRKLESAAMKVSGYLVIDRPTTCDGYTWYCGLTFIRGDTKVAILFPWAHDFDAPDGNTDDRSIAVYVLRGNWRTVVVDIITDLCNCMLNSVSSDQENSY